MPCNIARQLSKKDMESCPKARKALDAEWEHSEPLNGLGAWDESRVMEADQARAKVRQDGKIASSLWTNLRTLLRNKVVNSKMETPEIK